MDTEKALEVKKAILTLSELTAIESIQIVARVCLFDKKINARFLEASKIWNEFDDADIVKRGKMLGFEVVVE